MSFYIIYLFIILAYKAIFVESRNVEALALYNKFCANLDVAHNYRATKEWINLRAYNKQQPTEDKIKDFEELKYCYYSIERFLGYCEFLKNARDCANEIRRNKTMKQRGSSEPISQDCYDTTKFQHIALKPKFKCQKGKTMPIGDAMQDCTKVHAWVYYYSKNGAYERKVATPILEAVQMHLLEDVALNLKKFPPPPPQQQPQHQTAEKPKTNQPQKNSASSSSSSSGTYSYQTDKRRQNKTVLVILEHPVQTGTIVVLDLPMPTAVMGFLVVIVILVIVILVILILVIDEHISA
uniref:SCP domain-containing protein n=1 Tax=Globodera pallida TaxID=36090 RepID=A0A183CHC1_GLOPA